MKTLLEKIAKAKKEIASIEIKKNGKNEFSKYDYFTPSYVESLVSKVCEEHGLLTMFNLKRNELGEYGELSIIEIETGDIFTLTMATAIPEIKATNVSQQIGGCMTYTERYIKMSAFGIIDNRLDFDPTENSKKREDDLKAKLDVLFKQIDECTNKEDLAKIWAENSQLKTNEQFKSKVSEKGKQLK